VRVASVPGVRAKRPTAATDVAATNSFAEVVVPTLRVSVLDQATVAATPMERMWLFAGMTMVVL
jgi:hypothetical protein